MPTPTAPLSYVYLDGPDFYAYDAQVRTFVMEDQRYAPTCQAECGESFALGEVIIVTDANAEGESFFHLACLLQTSGALMATAEVEEEIGSFQREPRHGRG